MHISEHIPVVKQPITVLSTDYIVTRYHTRVILPHYYDSQSGGVQFSYKAEPTRSSKLDKYRVVKKIKLFLGYWEVKRK